MSVLMFTSQLLFVPVWACLAAAFPANPTPLRAGNPPQAMNFTLEGKITKLDQNKLTVNSEENIIFHVIFDDKTEIKRADGTAGAAKDLRVGLKIRVDGDLEESGEITAHKILIEGEKQEK